MKNSRISRRKFKVLCGSIFTAGILSFFSKTVFAKSNNYQNIRGFVMIVADDAGFDFGCYGNNFINTPNVDELSSMGVRFTRCFTPTAICSPSRSSIFTGMYPHSNGHMGFAPKNILHSWVKTAPAFFKEAGVFSGLIGKFHVSPKELFPWDFNVPPNELGFGRDPELFGEAVENFLKQVGGKRFFLSVNSQDPHRPFPEKGVKKGRAKEVENPHNPEKVMIPPFFCDHPEVRKEFAAYYDAVMRFDRVVGKVVKALKKAERFDDSLIIVTSDNGIPFPRAKTTLYDAGINMPFIVTCPGVAKENYVTDQMISFNDILPTAFECFGMKSHEQIQGRSFLPIIKGEKQKNRDIIFATHTDHAGGRHYPSRAVRTKKYKYIINLRNELEFRNNAMGSATWKAMLEVAEKDPFMKKITTNFVKRPHEELYDLEKDPNEFNNLADNPRYSKVRKKMKEKLKNWMFQTKDPLSDYW